MSSKLLDDPRIDPRIKERFRHFNRPVCPNVASRDELLALFADPAVAAAFEEEVAFYRSTAPDDHPSWANLIVTTETFISSPDGNRVNIQYIRPRGSDLLPCVYYIHGGGMIVHSAYMAHYSAWGKIIAAHGVAVAMVDFRNALIPSSAPEVAPYPAGLNDCAAGLRWVCDNAGKLEIDPQQIVICGDSGGGNLALATAMKLIREGDGGLYSGVYALCPFIAGSWPSEEHPSTYENNGIFLDLHHNQFTYGYGIEAFQARDPLAWPLFATDEDVKALPPVVISVNECDPLRDEGVSFYRLLLRNGVQARCRQVMGTVHATEVFPACAPNVSHSTANDIAYFARTSH